MRVGVGHAWLESNVRRHNGGTRGGGDGQITLVGESADVVTDQRTFGEGGFGHRRAPRVNTYGHIETTHQFGDYRHDAFEFLHLIDLVTGSGLDAANVQQVRALAHESLSALEEGVEIERRGWLVEGVLRSIEYAHHQCARREVVSGRADRQRYGRSRLKDPH